MYKDYRKWKKNLITKKKSWKRTLNFEGELKILYIFYCCIRYFKCINEIYM